MSRPWLCIMRTASSLTLILMLGAVKGVAVAEPLMEDAMQQISPKNEDLFLTPLINNNRTEEAIASSRVQFFQQFGVEAYSGFITVNENTNSNLFFLFTMAEGNKNDSPLLLWTQGGPGQSALFGQFLQNGPVAFDYENESFPFTLRNNTLQKNMSIIYLDLPVGAGFSFTEDQNAYPTSMEEISASVMEFLLQFLKLFPSYVCRDLYVAGESYGARYSVAIADALLTNEKNVLLKLKGVIGGNGFLGPILEIADSSNFLYWTSMLNESGRTQMLKQFKILRNLSQTVNASFVPGLLFHTIFADPMEKDKTLFQNLTSYNDHASPLYTQRPFNFIACYWFLNNSSDVRQWLHVKLTRPFEYFNLALVYALANDSLRDISNITQRVLNESNVLLYTGQLDALFPSVNQRRYYARLNWTQAHEYRKTQRTPWRPPTWKPHRGYAGFVKRVRRFAEVVLLGMSHYGAAEKSDEVYYLMMDFIYNWTKND